jgi:CheY-like chemotaxis protein
MSEASPVHAKHVLVAEDEPQVRDLLRRLLEAHGYVVHEAENGLAAAEYARSGAADIVITDLWMPVMNGVELIEALVSMACPAEVIVLSAHLTSSSTDKLRGLGVFRVLRKPVDLSALVDAVGAGLKSDRRGRLAGELAGRLCSRVGSEFAERPTVLVADDDDGVRDLLREALSRAGYRVEEARDGEEAVEKALAHDTSCVLMDLNMPRMNGRQAVENLRRASQHCFIICITGECSQREIDEALRAGAVSCLRKPFDPEALVAEVERLDLVAVHRRRLEEREHAYSAQRPFLERMRTHVRSTKHRYGRRLKWLAAAVVMTVVLSAAAVPVISSFVGATSRAVRAASGRAGEALDSAARVEGYLQRDEARELTRDGR